LVPASLSLILKVEFGQSEMRHDQFQQRTKQWLSKYKREVLRVNEDGIWLRNGRRYPHILPQEKYTLNILQSFRTQLWEWFPSQRIQLQRDFHHLNSSQALCFNLFFPLMCDEQGLASLISVVGIEDSPTGAACFEFQPDLTEGTCIDFSFTLQSGRRVNFEIKYTESEFGSAKPDEAHKEKFERVYRPRISGRFEESFCCTRKFLEHYQIARNVWHLNEATGDIAVFLFPKGNDRLRQQEPIIKSCALEPFRSRIRVVYLEDFIHNLRGRVRPTDTRLRHYLEEFGAKYLDFLEKPERP
jgi:hypothetical protein